MGVSLFYRSWPVDLTQYSLDVWEEHKFLLSPHQDVTSHQIYYQDFPSHYIRERAISTSPITTPTASMLQVTPLPPHHLSLPTLYQLQTVPSSWSSLTILSCSHPQE